MQHLGLLNRMESSSLKPGNCLSQMVSILSNDIQRKGHKFTETTQDSPETNTNKSWLAFIAHNAQIITEYLVNRCRIESLTVLAVSELHGPASFPLYLLGSLHVKRGGSIRRSYRSSTRDVPGLQHHLTTLKDHQIISPNQSLIPPQIPTGAFFQFLI